MRWLWTRFRRTSLTRWIIIFMVIGALVGWLNPDLGTSLKPLSTVFLRMIKSIVVPIIFGSLVIGIAGHGDWRRPCSSSPAS
jgi:proton glutamate symport protein